MEEPIVISHTLLHRMDQESGEESKQSFRLSTKFSPPILRNTGKRQRSLGTSTAYTQTTTATNEGPDSSRTSQTPTGDFIDSLGTLADCILSLSITPPPPSGQLLLNLCSAVVHLGRAIVRIEKEIFEDPGDDDSVAPDDDMVEDEEDSDEDFLAKVGVE